MLPTGTDALDDAVIREAVDDWQRESREAELKEQFNLLGARTMAQQPQLELLIEPRASYTPYTSSNTPGSNPQVEPNKPQTPSTEAYVYMILTSSIQLRNQLLMNVYFVTFFIFLVENMSKLRRREFDVLI